MGRERNYMGIFLEYYLPKYGVRFIAIGDSVDTSKGENDIIPLLNLFNEWHVKSTSMKVRAVKDMGAKQGKNVNGSAPYGYKYNKELGKLVIDNEVAEVVRRIFRLCMEGYGPSQIANILTEDKIQTYTSYNGFKPIKSYTTTEEWSATSVSSILENKAYIGYRVNKMTYSLSYKNRKRIMNEEKDMLLFPDAHEPIIEQSDFEQVQKLRKKRSRKTKTGEKSIYSGLLFCKDCGRIHHLHRGNKKEPHKHYYYCGNYKSKGRGCTPHSIRLTTLENILIDEIREVTKSVIENEDAFVRRLEKVALRSEHSTQKEKKHELTKCNKRIVELDMFIQNLFEEHAKGNMTTERYIKISQSYENEQIILSAKTKTLEMEITNAKDAISGIGRFVKIVKKYLNLQKLDYVSLRELIEKVVVHEKTKEPGIGSRGRTVMVSQQKIEIYFNFVGIIE